MYSPKISIIIPIFKVEEYLKDCIDSVIQQTYTNLEIILVNDGSPDNCGAICDAYAKQDARITVIHKENGGLSDARNAGLDICTGDYIAFVDSDDVIHPRFIEVLYTNLLEASADISFCDFEKFTETKNIQFSKIHQSEKINLNGLQMIDHLYDTNWMPKNVVVWNKLYIREIFSNLRFPKGLVHEDGFVFLDIYKCNPPIIYSNLRLYYYRNNSESIMSKKFSEINVQSVLKVIDKIIQFAKFTNRQQLLKTALAEKYNYLILGFFNKNNIICSIICSEKLIMPILLHKQIMWKTKIVFIQRLIFRFLNRMISIL